EIGILHGLAEAGVDLTEADVVVGTSAGSVVGTQVTSERSLAELYDDQLAPPDHEIGASVARATMVRMMAPLLLPGTQERRMQRIGTRALQAHPAGGEERIEVIRHRIGAADWPDRDLRITAVEAQSGEFTVFDKD